MPTLKGARWAFPSARVFPSLLCHRAESRERPLFHTMIASQSLTQCWLNVRSRLLPSQRSLRAQVLSSVVAQSLHLVQASLCLSEDAGRRSHLTRHTSSAMPASIV